VPKGYEGKEHGAKVKRYVSMLNNGKELAPEASNYLKDFRYLETKYLNIDRN
jgi:hypothetical protein